MAHDHHLWLAGLHIFHDELAVGLVILPAPLRVLVEHHVASDVQPSWYMHNYRGKYLEK
jgi:hypothetical protein